MPTNRKVAASDDAAAGMMPNFPAREPPLRRGPPSDPPGPARRLPAHTGGVTGELPLRLPRRAGRRTNLGLLALLLTAGGTGRPRLRGRRPRAERRRRRRCTARPASGCCCSCRGRPSWSAGPAGGRSGAATPPPPSRSACSSGSPSLTGVLHAVGVAGPWAALGGITALHVHVGAAIAVLPLLAIHAWGKRQRPRATDLSRRSLLRAGGARRRCRGALVRQRGRAPADRRSGRRTAAHRLARARHRRSDRDAGHPVDRRHRARGAGPTRSTSSSGAPDPAAGGRPGPRRHDPRRPRLHRRLVRRAGVERRPAGPPAGRPAAPTCPPTAASTSSRSPASGGGSPCTTPAACCSPSRPPGSRSPPATARRSGWSRPAGAASGG